MSITYIDASNATIYNRDCASDDIDKESWLLKVLSPGAVILEVAL